MFDFRVIVRVLVGARLWLSLGLTRALGLILGLLLYLGFSLVLVLMLALEIKFSSCKHFVTSSLLQGMCLFREAEETTEIPRGTSSWSEDLRLGLGL